MVLVGDDKLIPMMMIVINVRDIEELLGQVDEA